MKRIGVGGAALAALLWIGSQPAAAQPAPQPQAQPEPAEAPAPAASPRQLELAGQLLGATGVDTAMAAMMHNMTAQIAASANRNLSPQAQAKAEIIAQAEDHMFAKLTPRIVEMMRTAYARTFSEQELSDLIAFYQTPAGREAVTKMPQLLSSVTSQMLEMMPQIRRDMGEEICAKLACTPAQKAAYFGAAPASTPSPSP
jgi:hypothetical protein